MNARVATTQWSQILAAREGSESEVHRALEILCQTYWQPLYAYVRAQGNDPEEASDLTQAYFAELLEKDFLAQVDPDEGPISRLPARLDAQLSCLTSGITIAR